MYSGDDQHWTDRPNPGFSLWKSWAVLTMNLFMVHKNRAVKVYGKKVSQNVMFRILFSRWIIVEFCTTWPVKDSGVEPTRVYEWCTGFPWERISFQTGYNQGMSIIADHLTFLLIQHSCLMSNSHQFIAKLLKKIAEYLLFTPHAIFWSYKGDLVKFG